MAFAIPLRVFCSYAHEDDAFRRKFRKQGRPLELTVPPYILQWDDREICAGMNWEAEINLQAHDAELFILLITDDFLNSGYCLGKELSLAMEKSRSKRAAIIPVIVRDCAWEYLPEISRFQVLPIDGEPAGRKDKSWKQVIAGIKKTIDALCEGKFFALDLGAEGFEVPDLIAYGCGRESQETSFIRALEQAPRNRPFVIVLTGATGQGHNQTIDRLIGKAGAVLGLRAEHAIYDPEPGLRWSEIEAPEDLCIQLSSILDQQNSAAITVQYLADAVATHPGLTVIRSTWVSRNWRSNTRRLLSEFMKIWETWPDLQIKQHLLIFLSVSYEPQDEPANLSMAAEIAGILSRSSLLKLRLPSINGSEALHWLRTTPELGHNYDRETASACVREFIEEEDKMPLEELVRRLKPVLARFQR